MNRMVSQDNGRETTQKYNQKELLNDLIQRKLQLSEHVPNE